MKFVISQNNKKSVWFLTKGMVDALKSVSIEFDQLDQLPKYVHLLTPSEIAIILKLQDIIAGKFGVPILPPVLNDVDAINRTLIERALNTVSSEDLQQHFNAHNKFYVHTTQNGFVLCLANKDETGSMPGWEPLAADTLVPALLEGVYEKFGYNEVHFKEVVKTSVNEFSLANIFNLMAVTN